MRTLRTTKLFSVLTILVLLAACAAEKPKEEAKPIPPPPPPVSAPAPTPAPVVAPPVARNPLTDPNNILSKRSVYFDFDKYDIKPEYRPLVEAHAKYLLGNGGATIAIQGNCDERGSREYNLALGQRRADAVGKVMTLLGVKATQIETVSFGEEKPRALGHDEAAWAENRRSDIVYQREK